jgi:hypothetical protein
MSYYISTIYPKKFKYILNDNDKINYDLFNISRDPKLTEMFNQGINKIITEWNSYTNDTLRKEFYKNLDKNEIEVYIFKAKVHTFRFGVYPSMKDGRHNQVKPFRLQDYPIYDFYNNEYVCYENIDAVDFIEKHNETDNKIFLLDPPYLKSYNQAYNNFNLNIYDWIKVNEKMILESNNIFIYTLEEIDDVKAIFQNYKVALRYDKYYSMSKKNTTHVVYSN